MTNFNLSRFSIIIATWKRDDLLKDCLESLLKVYGLLPEIIVVDNAQLESTQLLCAQYFGVRYLSAEGNLGFAGGNNLGLGLCHREYVILLNNDTLFREDSITPLLEFMDAHQKVALAQGRSVYADEPTLLDGCGIFFNSIGQVECSGEHEALGGPSDVTRPMPAGGGPFCIFRRSALPAVGGKLYHDFFWAYFEDVDLSLRVWRSGYEFWYVSTPPILHRKSLTGKMFPSSKIFRHIYFNQTVSYFTCFDIRGWMCFFPVRISCYFIKAVLLTLCLKPEYMLVHVKVLVRLWRERDNLMVLRRRLATLRKVNDINLLHFFAQMRKGVFKNVA